MLTRATVTSVDADKCICKCRDDINGMTYLNVTWMNPVGGSGKPSVGDSVRLVRDGGSWLIFGVVARPTANTPYVPPISLGKQGAETGNIATFSGTTFNQGSSADEIPGDKIMRSKGGAIVGALLGGSVIAKASSLCMIFLSKYDDIIKLFSRNYEKFNEARSEVNINKEGRTFSVEENYANQEGSRSGTAAHRIITGDVELGKVAGINYRDFTEGTEPSNVIRREEVGTVYSEDLKLDGSVVETITDGATTLLTESSVEKFQITFSTGSTSHTILVDPGEVKIDSGAGSSTLELKGDGNVYVKGTTAIVDVPMTTFKGSVLVENLLTVASGLAVGAGATATAGKAAISGEMEFATGSSITAPGAGLPIAGNVAIGGSMTVVNIVASGTIVDSNGDGGA